MDAKAKEGLFKYLDHLKNKNMEMLFKPRDEGDHRVIYIEYQDGIPHSATIEDVKHGYLTHYDLGVFENDKKDLFYYQCGSGGNKKKLQPPSYISTYRGGTYWIHPTAAFKGRVVNCRRLEKPLELESYWIKDINPFIVADEVDHYEYCTDCGKNFRDHCEEHQYYDEKDNIKYYNE